MEQQEADKFTSELLWCINQLEQGLQTQSPSSRQAQDTMRMIKTLRSPKAPMVKKRQVMRNALGDYRKKMKEGEKKSLSAMKHSRFQDAAKCKSHLKSRFLRQSHTKQGLSVHDAEWKSLNFTLDHMSLTAEGCSTQGVHPDPLVAHDNGTTSRSQPTITTNSNSCPLEEKIILSAESEAKTCSLDTNVEEKSTFKFVPSDNSFLFSFHCDERNNSDVQPANQEVSNRTLINEPCSSNSQTDEKCTDFAEVSKKNFYHFEKSENDFSFNFDNVE